jgi:hypothetical protein
MVQRRRRDGKSDTPQRQPQVSTAANSKETSGTDNPGRRALILIAGVSFFLTILGLTASVEPERTSGPYLLAPLVGPAAMLAIIHVCSKLGHVKPLPLVELALVVAAIAGSFVGIAVGTLSDKGWPSSSYIPASSTVVTDDPSDELRAFLDSCKQGIGVWRQGQLSYPATFDVAVPMGNLTSGLVRC